VFVESGGDDLAAFFSPELVEASVYVVDVAGGDKVPRKGGPGVTRSELLVVNKVDLAPMVGADLAVMEGDARSLRGTAPVVMALGRARGRHGGSGVWVETAPRHRIWEPAVSDARPEAQHHHSHGRGHAHGGPLHRDGGG